MAEEKKTESAGAGSSKAGEITPAADPNLRGGLGQSATKEPQAKGEYEGTEQKPSGSKEETVPKSQYDELTLKLGEQGKELGDNRTFIEEISPLLNRLEGREDLVKAIMEDKISPDLLASALKGEVSTEEAKTATKAQEEVKKEMGKEAYAKASSEEITKLVSDKIAEAMSKTRDEFSKRMADSEEIRAFEDQIQSFIANTPDFPEYAQGVQDYLDAHPTVDDMEVAYDAVKGRALAKKQKEKEQEEAGEAAKNVALNAAGGAVKSTQTVSDPAIVDQLIAGRSNPNIF